MWELLISPHNWIGKRCVDFKRYGVMDVQLEARFITKTRTDDEKAIQTDESVKNQYM